MSVVALAMVLLDSHVSRRDTRTDATIVAERGRHRADGHIASTQFVLQAQRVTNRRRAKRSRLRSSSRERSRFGQIDAWRIDNGGTARVKTKRQQPNTLAVRGIETRATDILWRHVSACLDESPESG